MANSAQLKWTLLAKEWNLTFSVVKISHPWSYQSNPKLPPFFKIDSNQQVFSNFYKKKLRVLIILSLMQNTAILQSERISENIIHATRY